MFLGTVPKKSMKQRNRDRKGKKRESGLYERDEMEPELTVPTLIGIRDLQGTYLVKCEQLNR